MCWLATKVYAFVQEWNFGKAVFLGLFKGFQGFLASLFRVNPFQGFPGSPRLGVSSGGNIFQRCQGSAVDACRRLLHDKSSSDDHERGILGRLKQQCGAAFTSKVRMW